MKIPASRYTALFILTIALLSCTFALTGCQQQQTSGYENIKISDLPPQFKNVKPLTQNAVSAEFVIYTFQIPAADYPEFASVWPDLGKGRLQFINETSFAVNGFEAGFGSEPDWPKVRDRLIKFNAKRKRRTNMLSLGDQGDLFMVQQITDEQTVFYTTAEQSIAGVTMNNGKAGLRIFVTELPDVRAAVNVRIVPVFEPIQSRSVISRLRNKEPERTSFNSAALYYTASPGDFVLLGPQKPTKDKLTLSGLFFNPNEPGPIQYINIYMIVCIRTE